MRKVSLILFSIFLWTSVCYTWNIKQVVPVVTIKSVTQKAFARPYYNLAKCAVIIGACIWLARFINDQRNAESSFRICEEEEDGVKFFKIQADGLLTVKGGSKDEYGVKTEILDQDRLVSGSKLKKMPVKLELSWWKKVWYWIREPSHRRVLHHIVTVPSDKNIDIISTNKHPFAHRFRDIITVKDIDGTIKAEACSGDVHVLRPGGQVTVSTPNSIKIEDFKYMVIAQKGFQHFHATRHKTNKGYDVYLKGEVAPRLNVYDYCGDDEIAG